MKRPALTLRDLRILLENSAAETGPNEDAVAARATWEQTVFRRGVPIMIGVGVPSSQFNEINGRGGLDDAD